MIQDIYKAILSNGFTSRGQDLENNKRLGIKRTFTDKAGRYIEIYPEIWGFSVFIYGNGFMNGYYPYNHSVCDKKDIKELCDKIQNVLDSNSNQLVGATRRREFGTPSVF